MQVQRSLDLLCFNLRTRKGVKNEDDPRKVTNIVAFAKIFSDQIYNWASTLKNALILTKFLFSGEKKDNGDDIDPLLDEAAGDLSVNLEIAA